MVTRYGQGMQAKLLINHYDKLTLASVAEGLRLSLWKSGIQILAVHEFQ